METSLDQYLEAILFYRSQPVAKKDLIGMLGITTEELAAGSEVLRNRLAAGATTLLESDTELSLVTKPLFDAVIEQLRRDELKRDIGKAGAETLAIVLYRSPITRSEIDRIRGVNSSYILRNLLVRGLVEKTSNPKRTEYQTTSDALAHLGITRKQDLPGYETVLNQLAVFEQQTAENNGS